MKFDIAKLRKYIEHKNFLKRIEYFEEIDSTNTYLKNSNEIDRRLVIADFQTSGRGRFNRKWISNKGENLTFSLGIEKFEIGLITKLVFLIPTVIHNSIKELYDLEPEFKWPNDLLLDKKKFCGILIENIIDNQKSAKLVLGIGINCNQLDFPDEISYRTTSLKKILNNEINREKLLAKIIDNLSIHWEQFLRDQMQYYYFYKSKCFSIGKLISILFNEKIFTGIFKDVNENGELILQTNLGELIFNSGEITTIKE